MRRMPAWPWIAALPMYNVTPRHDALWRALLRDALDAFANAGGPADVTLPDEPFADLHALWRRDDLLLSQTCGYPYRMLGLRDVVRLIATPCSMRTVATAHTTAACWSYRHARMRAARRRSPHAAGCGPHSTVAIRTAG